MRRLKKNIVKSYRKATGHLAEMSGATAAKILKEMPGFAPASAGSDTSRAAQTLATVNDVFPATARMLDAAFPARSVNSTPIGIAAFRQGAVPAEQEAQLKSLLDARGSDKASWHDYYLLYSRLFDDLGNVEKVVEVGIGSQSTQYLSHMGSNTTPGSSLRALRDFFPAAQVFGADIDPQVLFEEERIRTVVVDQTDPQSFAGLAAIAGADVDLLIDDGLHSPDANLNTLAFGLTCVRSGGWIVIEDIAHEALDVWRAAARMLSERGECSLVEARHQCLFAIRLA